MNLTITNFLETAFSTVVDYYNENFVSWAEARITDKDVSLLSFDKFDSNYTAQLCVTHETNIIYTVVFDGEQNTFRLDVFKRYHSMLVQR